MLKLLRPSLKLSKVLDLYLKAQGKRLAPNTVRLTELAWRQMTEFLGNIRLKKFMPETAERVQAHWLSAVSTNTARIYRKQVCPVFSWALRRGYIKAHPFKKLAMPKSTKRKVKTFTDKEFKRLIDACDDLRWVTMLLVARSTGMRKSAIQNLTVGDVDFENEVINVTEKFDTNTTWPWQPKDREERPLPLISIVTRCLTELMFRKPANQPYWFLRPSRYYYLIEARNLGLLVDSMRMYPVSNFDRKFRKIRKKAGVTGMFKQMRSTCLTDLSAVLNLNELKEIAGHSDIETTMRYYVATGPDTVSKALNRVNKSLGDPLTPSQAR